MFITNVKNAFRNSYNRIREVLNDSRIKIQHIKGHNVGLAVDYFDLGMIKECYNRLIIMNKLWPNYGYIHYLLGILYVFDRDNNKAIAHLRRVNGPKFDHAKKMIDIINSNKVDKIIDSYIDKPGIDTVEYEISNIEI